jgi:cytidylate kinase
VTEILITIDGGAAAGKSTTARAVAEALDLLHVDTGAHYRTLTLWLIEQSLHELPEVALAQALAAAELGTAIQGRTARLAIGGAVPEPEQLRSEEVNQAVSRFAALPVAREALKSYQRSQRDVARDAGFKGLVMEGRDIGSVIFPEARHRFFLQADARARQARRNAEGQSDAIAQRDHADSTRKTAPLKCPEGAVKIDTTQLSVEQVVARIRSEVLA